MTTRPKNPPEMFRREASQVVPFAAPAGAPVSPARRTSVRDTAAIGLDSLAWAALDFVQAPGVDALLEDFRTRLAEVVDAGTCQVFFVERSESDPTLWKLTDSGHSVLGVSLNLLLQSKDHLWQALALGRHVEIGAGGPDRGPDPLETPDRSGGPVELRSYLLLAPIGSSRGLHAVLCLEVPHGKPKPSPVQLLHLRQLCQQVAIPLVRLSEIEALSSEVEALRNENVALRRREAPAVKPADAEEEAPEPGADARIFIKDRVLSNFAHDLGTPTVTIRGYSRILLDGRAGPLNSIQKDYLKMIHTNAARLVGLVHAMNRPMFTQSFDLDSFDLLELWRECRRRFDLQIRAKSVTIVEEFPDRPCFVTADRRKIADVLDKLLSNSLKFTEPQDRVRITVAPDHRGEISMRFSDTGVGIAPELLNRIFTYEAATHSVIGPRDGIEEGLATVRDTVRAQGGRIWANANDDEGPTFELALISTEEVYQYNAEGER